VEILGGGYTELQISGYIRRRVAKTFRKEIKNITGVIEEGTESGKAKKASCVGRLNSLVREAVVFLSIARGFGEEATWKF
jgi:hypothetical protein